MCAKLDNDACVSTRFELPEINYYYFSIKTSKFTSSSFNDVFNINSRYNFFL
jgi:hypothetical protein